MMQRLPLTLIAAALAVAPSAGFAQIGDMADLSAIDAQVAAFTGFATGTPGGARHPVDRRLRLAACPQPLSLSWHGRRADMVSVECTAGSPWRIFVPVNAATTAAGHNAQQAAFRHPAVERGQVITLTIQGRGFSVSQQGEVLEQGVVGEWVRVRPEGNREEVRARIESPGRAVIPLS